MRSLWYGHRSTVVTLVIGYPVAYWIAFKGGRNKTTYLFLMLLPFFVSFMIRSLAWQFMLSDRDRARPSRAWGLLPQGFHILATSTAVISGIAYNSLPVHGAAAVRVAREDRPARRRRRATCTRPARTFLKVILPLSIPGIFAGFLLTFIPAVGDYVNKHPGRHEHDMIGNIVQESS